MYIIPTKEGIPHVISMGRELTAAIKRYFNRIGAKTILISRTEEHTPEVVEL